MQYVHSWANSICLVTLWHYSDLLAIYENEGGIELEQPAFALFCVEVPFSELYIRSCAGLGPARQFGPSAIYQRLSVS